MLQNVCLALLELVRREFMLAVDYVEMKEVGSLDVFLEVFWCQAALVSCSLGNGLDLVIGPETSLYHACPS